MLSYSAGYFSVPPSEEFWLNPGDFLGFSGTGAASGIGYRWPSRIAIQTALIWLVNAFHVSSNCSLEEADYDDGGDKIEEEESAVKFHVEVPINIL